MDKCDEMIQTGIDALRILKKLKSDDPVTVKTAMEDHLRLVDRFYRENYEMVAPQQYEAARKGLWVFSSARLSGAGVLRGGCAHRIIAIRLSLSS